jgi:hypothetical protein
VTYLGIVDEEDGNEEDDGEADDDEDPLWIKNNQQGN